MDLGPCEIHRMGWSPVRLAMVGRDPMQPGKQAAQDDLPL
jgi:hypothetical protein